MKRQIKSILDLKEFYQIYKLFVNQNSYLILFSIISERVENFNATALRKDEAIYRNLTILSVIELIHQTHQIF